MKLFCDEGKCANPGTHRCDHCGGVMCDEHCETMGGEGGKELCPECANPDESEDMGMEAEEPEAE